jgi:carbonic anhydrase/acetyltransferase-like protein (isoleucine patch superfamily)
MLTTIGDGVTIGHGSIIHGCRLMDRAFVGMGAIILNGATIESDGMLAAGAVLTSGKRIQTGELWAGSPAKLLRKLRDEELVEIRRNADHYTSNGAVFRSSLFACVEGDQP